jgi:CubicO group peptidase (beta-lactamase class C family)
MCFEKFFCRLLLLCLNVLILTLVANSAVCPPDGPLLPRPTSLHTSSLISNVAQNLKSTLDKAVDGKITVPWLVSNISFSIAVVSLDTPNPSSPLWEYHHLATANTRGTKHVDGDSQYLIGSISKMVTDLLLLKTGLPLDDPITKYLPELLSPDSPIRWDEITLGSLGDHLSGMPYDCKLSQIKWSQYWNSTDG